jgi:ligand-binding sensor domain-containing protein
MDRKDRLWIGVQEGGLHLYEEDGDRFIRLEERHSVGSNNIVDIFEDSDARLWLATWGGGLKQVLLPDSGSVSRESVEFITYAANGGANSISSNNVWSIEEDDAGNLWIGTYHGLNFWNRKTGVFSHYTHDYANPHSISSNYVSSIYKDRSGVLWIGTFRGNIDKFVPALQNIGHYKHNPNDENSLSHNEISAMYEDNQGIIWIGTLGGGLNRFDPRNKKFSHYEHDPNDPFSISSNSILCMMGDHRGTIWIGTPNGLNRFDGKGKFEKYIYNPRSVRGMSGNMITAMLKGSFGSCS